MFANSVVFIYCVARGLKGSFPYKCPASRGCCLRQHGFLVEMATDTVTDLVNIKRQGNSDIPLHYPGRRTGLRPGRRPVASWNLACHALSSELAPASRSASSCDQTWSATRSSRRPVASWNLAYHALAI